MKKLLNAKPILHKNVKGDPLYYIEITGEAGEKYHINVGTKTYDTCKKMEQELNSQQESDTMTQTKKAKKL